MDPRPPRLFETLTLPNIAGRCFVVRVADDQIRPELIPAAGTAYNHADYKLPTRLHVETWGTYVYGWPIEAPADYSAFVFVPSLPTTPVVKPRNDDIWGPVIDHTYYCLRSATLPDLADTNVTVLGASYSSRHVVAVSEPREMSGEVIEVTVTTAAAATVTQTDKPVDLASGSSYTRTKTYTVATSSPAAVAPQTDGSFTQVQQLRHNLFLSTADRASTLPNSRELAITWDSHDNKFWPEVAQNLQWITVRNPSLSRWRQLLTQHTRNAYSGECRVTTRLWWQNSAYTVPEPDAMIPTAMRVNGNLESFTIGPCLHGPFTYEEMNFAFNPNADTFNGADFIMLQFNFSATSHIDWPETCVKVSQRFVNGGYEVTEETFHRPSNYNTSVNTINSRNWVPSDGFYYDL